ncbi:MAG: iron chelate uptake ABC transporter family permease subunit [Firmicutes bacterium]|nr:iron chelate uptake ABC transporter family permease subunit [Bacillota bacterium]
MLKRRYLVLLLIVFSVATLGLGLQGLDQHVVQILMISRIPRLLTVILVGMSMAIAGLIMQQISRNRFVSPTTAGTIDAAKGGVICTLLFFPGAAPLVKMSIVFLFALAGTFIFMFVLRKIKFKNVIFVPLLGIMFGNIFNSITTFVAYRHDLVQNISAWLMGNFALVTQGRYELLYLSLPLLVIAFIFAHQFTIAGMGEEFAINLGLNYNFVVNIGVALVALLAALVVVTVGQVPFLGLIVPNIITIFYGDNIKGNLTATALLGAVLLLGADLFGRVLIAPYEIPVGLTVGTLGSMLFLYLIFRGERK